MKNRFSIFCPNKHVLRVIFPRSRTMHASGANTVCRAILALSLALALCACAGCLTLPAAGDNPAAAIPQTSVEPPPLKPGLTLDIRVLVDGDVEINVTDKRVRNDGTIMLPLLGSVPVEGYTLGELSAFLEKAYNDAYFVRPSVEAEFSRDGNDAVSPWGSVTVLGRVKNPGVVSIPPTRDLTVTRAIQKAGGFDTSARSSSIRVSRSRPNAEPEQIQVNLDAVGMKGEQDADLVLRPGDIVFVPESIF